MHKLQKNRAPSIYHAEKILPGNFHAENHFYKHVLESVLHPTAAAFLKLTNEQIIARYVELHPLTRAESLKQILAYQPKYFYWSGADLIHATDSAGNRRLLIIETNSCPSGQKSMPPIVGSAPRDGYRAFLQSSFCQYLSGIENSTGVLAVLYDKNSMENLGYATALANLMNEPVYFAKWHAEETAPCVRRGKDFIEVCDQAGEWRPVRACLRYVTQKPWQRVPLDTKTFIFNPVAACLAGGRNKALAAKAYAEFNAKYISTGLEIHTPETHPNIELKEIAPLVARLGGMAVVKNPYSNAGQGVWTITNTTELNDFLSIAHDCKKFIVQELIGSPFWQIRPDNKKLCHIGTKPNLKNETFAFDLRFMISSQQDGFRPVVFYGRRAHKPLDKNAFPSLPSWDTLGTNLSVKSGSDWTTESDRLLCASVTDFETLGLDLNALTDAFVQSVMATVAIDQMAQRFMPNSVFDVRIFRELNNDATFFQELVT